MTVDYYSSYIELDVLQIMTAGTVIKALKAQLACHVIPDLVATDNRPQFSSVKFKDFAKEWNRQHQTSSPGYPQANRKAENAVKITKKLTKSALQVGSTPWLAL